MNFKKNKIFSHSRALRFISSFLLVVFLAQQSVYADGFSLAPSLMLDSRFHGNDRLELSGPAQSSQQLGFRESFLKTLNQQINPVAGYQNLFQSFAGGVKGLASKTGLAKFGTNTLTKIGVSFAQNKVDQQIEKSKMGSFWKSVLTTVANASIQAVGSSLESMANAQLGLTSTESANPRGPPTGLQAQFSFISDLKHGVTKFLKDAGGAVRSIFVGPSSGSTRGGGLDAAFSEIDQSRLLLNLDADGHIEFLSIEELNANIKFSASALNDGLSRFDTDGGNFINVAFNARTNQITSRERVGNLSLVDQVRGFADIGDAVINRAVSAVTNFYGPVGLSPTSTQVFLAGEFVKGYVDTLRLGDQFSAIKNDFLSGQAAFQSGDYRSAALDFGSAGLRSLQESSRLLNLLPLAGGAIKGAQVLEPVSLASRRLSSVTQRGVSVLGKYPDYIQLATELDAKKFSIPVQFWEKMTDAERWVANKKFLDRMIARGDKILLSNPVENIKQVSGSLRKELEYLVKKGFALSKDGTQMIR